MREADAGVGGGLGDAAAVQWRRRQRVEKQGGRWAMEWEWRTGVVGGGLGGAAAVERGQRLRVEKLGWRMAWRCGGREVAAAAAR